MVAISLRKKKYIFEHVVLFPIMFLVQSKCRHCILDDRIIMVKNIFKVREFRFQSKYKSTMCCDPV